jgi:pimeloyl-ACP methyl ester carboxylesterase
VSVAIDAGAGPSVLLVHGQPGNGIAWQRLAQLLELDHRVVAPDRPGWGDDDNDATGLAANALYLAGVVESLGLLLPVTVVGHSLGGGIALELALGRPDLVGALVVVGSIGPERAVGRFDRVLAVPSVGDRVIRAGLSASRRAVAAARRAANAPAVNSVVHRVSRFRSVRALLWLEGQDMSARERRSFLVEQRAMLQETPSLERGVPRIAVPTAVVHGTSDHIVHPVAARLLAEWIPGAELVWLKGEGHMVPFERPDLIAPIVRRYSSLAAR